MRILALDAALARCAAAVVVDREVLAARQADATQGHAALLPVMARDVLAEAGDGRGIARSGGGHRRARQLHRHPRRPRAGARHRARRRRPGGRRDGRRGARRARCRILGERRLWIGDRQPARPCVPRAGDTVISVALDALPVPDRQGRRRRRCGARGCRQAGGARCRRDADRRPAAAGAACRRGGRAPDQRGAARRCRRNRSMSIHPRRGCPPAACARRRSDDRSTATSAHAAALAAIHAAAFPAGRSLG